ncbi:MAG TPA: lysozyme inhibitor LprI family protein [Candidatus Cybelea sp.]
MPLLGAVVLAVAAATAPCDRGTTYDMRTCWDKQSASAGAELKSAYAKAAARMRGWGVSAAPLGAVQGAWTAARDKTCNFEYELYLPGTIAPQIAVECSVRMTLARTKRLDALLSALQTRDHVAERKPVSAAAAAQLRTLYQRYLAHLTGSQRTSLAAAQAAWAAYRDKACALEGGACLTELEKERIAELEASWVGEPFW